MRPNDFRSFAQVDGLICERAEDPRGSWSTPGSAAGGLACWGQRDNSLMRRWLQSTGASASTTAAVVWDEERAEIGYADEDYAVFFDDEELNEAAEEREAA